MPKDWLDMSDPFYSNPIYIAITDFLRSDGPFVYINLWTVVITTILFFVYCFSREGRDERGRAIVGTACLHGVIVLVVLINIFSQYTYTVISHPYIFANSLRLVYNGFFITMLISIAIQRKIR